MVSTTIIWCKSQASAACWTLYINGNFNVHAMIAVDLTQGQAPLPRGEPPVPGNHDLAATLKALAANSNSFGGSSAVQSANLNPDGIDPEMITRLGRCPKHPRPVDCIAPVLMQPVRAVLLSLRAQCFLIDFVSDYDCSAVDMLFPYSFWVCLRHMPPSSDAFFPSGKIVPGSSL